MSLGRGEVGECVGELREKAQELLQAQHLLAYLNWLLKIMELRYYKHRVNTNLNTLKIDVILLYLTVQKLKRNCPQVETSL